MHRPQAPLIVFINFHHVIVQRHFGLRMTFLESYIPAHVAPILFTSLTRFKTFFNRLPLYTTNDVTGFLFFPSTTEGTAGGARTNFRILQQVMANILQPDTVTSNLIWKSIRPSQNNKSPSKCPTSPVPICTVLHPLRNKCFGLISGVSISFATVFPVNNNFSLFGPSINCLSQA